MIISPDIVMVNMTHYEKCNREAKKGINIYLSILNLLDYFMLFNALNGQSVILVDTRKLNRKFLKLISWKSYMEVACNGYK